MDEILADLFGALLSEFQASHNVKGTWDDRHDTYMERCFPELNEIDVFNVLNRPGFFRTLKPLPGAQWAVRQIRNAGHSVFAFSSPGNTPGSMPDKYKWLDDHFPAIERGDRGFMRNKGNISADVFIDDAPRNAEDWRVLHPKGCGRYMMTIAYPHNLRDADLYDVRVGSWRDTTAAWEALVDEILFIGETGHSRAEDAVLRAPLAVTDKVALSMGLEDFIAAGKKLSALNSPHVPPEVREALKAVEKAQKRLGSLHLTRE